MAFVIVFETVSSATVVSASVIRPLFVCCYIDQVLTISSILHTFNRFIVRSESFVSMKKKKKKMDEKIATT